MAPVDRPLIVYLNHPSWWDPMTCLLLARHYWPERKHYAPIDAAALARYRFFERLGFFGVDQRRRRGGITFLRTASEILRQPSAALWITAQGHFTDPRARPIRLRPGLAHLLPRAPDASVLPLAVEYPFWSEKFPEALAAFGPPVDAGDYSGSSAESLTTLERRLEQTADLLAAAAARRDPADFQTLVGGRAGVTLPYDLWRRLRALVGRRPYNAEHGTAAR